ncbi:MAG: PhoH family protein, partial [Desulfobulbaceae bacterium]|nr:PhoH family protein [Desulfobulbaceae bacterium]
LFRDGHKNREDEETVRQKVDKLIKNNIIELEALTYIRGRSISRQYVIIDEAQNLTPHEVKTIISRAGDGTKMVLTGDPYQIDNPYLDSSSNGLAYAVDRLKGLNVHGHVTLRKSERSSLAAIAADYL